MGKKLSIIIPVFNGEKFVSPCLAALGEQVGEEAEIIVINDGSTDGTDQCITGQFQGLIERGSIIYRKTPNQGVSAARNLGIELASGDYIGFVDADDLVWPNYVATLFAAMDGAPSIIEFGYRTIDLSGNVLKAESHIHTHFGSHVPNAVLTDVFAACLWYPFLRVVDRNLFKEHRFPPGVRFCEDLIALSAIYKKAETIRSLPDVLYDYRINPGGATLNIKPDYAPPLIAHYRLIANDQSIENKLLKLNLAYALRRCIADTADKLGRLPPDIEGDLRAMRYNPQLFLATRPRLIANALWGAWIRRAKLIFS